MSYTYEYPRPSVTVDAVLFGYDETLNDLKVLLIQRKDPPYADHWALPGGFVDMDEDLETAAKRELEEETGVTNIFMEQLFTFGTPNRDPRGRVISVAYFALIPLDSIAPEAASDAKNVDWFSLHELPNLAFDHDEILRVSIARLRGKLRYQPIGFELLPEKFPLSALHKLYEIILQTPLDKRNFRKKILKMGVVKGLDEYQKGVAHRAAQLYCFDERKYEQLVKEGYSFEL